MKKIVYVSPVCHLDEVAAQMSVICSTSGEDIPVLSPEKDHGGVGVPQAPKIV